MVKIYLIRHGHSLGNEQGLVTGHFDCELSDTGKKQAELLSDYIVRNLKIDKFYSSPLIRAINTVLPAADRMNKEIIIEPAFIELSAGVWEGMPFAEAQRRYPTEFGLWINSGGDVSLEGVESWASVFERSKKRLDELAKENDGKVIAICSHGGIIKSLRSYLLGMGLDGIESIDWAPNASITEIEYNSGEYNLIGAGYDDFLMELKTNLPKTI